MSRKYLAAAVLVAGLLLMGCRQDMHDQPVIEGLEGSTFFNDGRGARLLPAGTVARGWLREDTRFWEGKDDAGEFIADIPVPVTQELLERGQQRFEIFCSVCHDSTGGGRGMIVRRGLKQPQPLYEQRLVEMPSGYFFDVMTNGFGIMSSYTKQVPVADRWAIVAYIRALQVSQTAQLAELPQELQNEFHAALAVAHDGGAHGGDDHGEGDHGSDTDQGDFKPQSVNPEGEPESGEDTSHE